MNRENIKTILLISLVILSLFLTYKIWFEMPSSVRVETPEENEEYPPEIQLLGPLSPDKVIIHFDSNMHMAASSSEEIYAQTWLYTQNMFKDFHNKSIQIKQVDESLWVKAANSRSLQINFNYDFSINFWLKVLNTNDLNELENRDIKFNKMIIYPDESLLLLKNLQSKIYSINLDKTSVDKIKSIISSAKGSQLPRYIRFAPKPVYKISVSPDIYIPGQLPSLPKVVLKRDELDINQFASLFFSNMSVVRKIKEKDGAMIFTDGQKGLRIYSDSAVEYNSALIDKSSVEQNAVEAFKLSGNFLYQHSGWSKKIYLKKIQKETAQKGHIFRITYGLKYKDYKILGNKPIIQIALQQNEVKNYYHLMKWPLNESNGYYKNVCDPSHAVDTVLKSLRMLIGLKKDTTLTNMYLAYYIDKNEEYLRPVWVLEFEEIHVLVDAIKCEVIATEG